VTVAPGFQEVLLIASVPLTDGNWRPFAEGELVAVLAGQVLGAVMPKPRASLLNNHAWTA